MCFATLPVCVGHCDLVEVCKERLNHGTVPIHGDLRVLFAVKRTSLLKCFAYCLKMKSESHVPNIFRVVLCSEYISILFREDNEKLGNEMKTVDIRSIFTRNIFGKVENVEIIRIIRAELRSKFL